MLYFCLQFVWNLQNVSDVLENLFNRDVTGMVKGMAMRIKQSWKTIVDNDRKERAIDDGRLVVYDKHKI